MFLCTQSKSKLELISHPWGFPVPRNQPAAVGRQSRFPWPEIYIFYDFSFIITPVWMNSRNRFGVESYKVLGFAIPYSSIGLLIPEQKSLVDFQKNKIYFTNKIGLWSIEVCHSVYRIQNWMGIWCIWKNEIFGDILPLGEEIEHFLIWEFDAFAANDVHVRKLLV